jgi:O-antigen/teichoic acid export membrane protein
MGFMDILKYIIGKDYWDGLKVIPIVMAAEIMMGIYFNLSFWYKLIDKTIWGAWFSGIGCAVLIAVNILFIPKYGYMACAWAGFAGYGTSMLLSYFVGQKKNPIDYPLKSIGSYVLLAAFFYGTMELFTQNLDLWLRIAANTLLLVLYVAHVVYHEKLYLRFRK